jgi:hypothetical protein
MEKGRCIVNEYTGPKTVDDVLFAHKMKLVANIVKNPKGNYKDKLARFRNTQLEYVADMEQIARTLRKVIGEVEKVI